ncbi:Serpentine Receptor, class U [Caenorhabditis elegans]|uniref:Serpentine Receptor, class U n=1 Tax=Caenorhabditis elegans TaxID=6239 RepID=Q95QT6_CAEEL|nr:Serpentine Receptor, class U [Caenorhabditis elegans]CCD64017.1 Serpentine Receptor, class U [Caenorhabditis elegans]|eukprot:NP_501450.1 Serpentine Receptor, class U [Caenorhabditis elegans]
MSAKNIFGNQTYMDFSFTFNTFPVYFALLPLFYVIPTIYIVNYTIFVFMEQYTRKKTCVVNPHIFIVVSSAHTVNILSFFFDYMSNRFPATGMMTSWCASSNHETLLIFILTSHFYLDYLAMGFPFFMSVLKIMFLVYPNTHKSIINKLLRIALPCISIYPVFNTFFLFPATGECRQLYPPYEFGSIFIHYFGEIAGFSNSPFLLANIAFWMGSTITINLMVIFLVAHARNKGSHNVQYKSRKSRRAELSVTLTTFAMIISFLMRGICLIVFLLVPSAASWLAIIRPLGSDAEVVVSPWVFYLTHPAFRRTKRQSTITVGFSISLGSGPRGK